MEHRVRRLNENPHTGGSCVVYWMQQAQRTSWNHALEYAVMEARSRRLPVYVFFGLTGNFPGANLRHCTFMLQGLEETAEKLNNRGIGFILRNTDPADGAIAVSKELDACMLITDCGHTRIQKNWRKKAAENLETPVLEVETDMVVPAWIASDHEETAAWTLRRKLTPHIPWFLNPPEEIDPAVDSSSHSVQTLDSMKTAELLELLHTDGSVKPSSVFTGGPGEAEKRWSVFLNEREPDYGKNARNPAIQGTSLLSPYLHFGQISPVRMAADVRERSGSEVFLEQLVVRRELAINFAHYNCNCDSFGSIPGWASLTLGKHMEDRREAIYTLEQLEGAKTHDEYWNAAQKELTETGHMHGYMRMYWGKKVIQWTEDPRTAHGYLVYLNDRYQLDGRDPNGYAGIAWCFGKHDRPFGTFPVTGNIRRLGSPLEKMRRAKSSRYNGYIRRISSEKTKSR